MKKKTKKLLMTIGSVVVLVGGAVHLLQPLGFNLLNIFGGVKGWVQGIAGAVTIAIIVAKWKK